MVEEGVGGGSCCGTNSRATKENERLNIERLFPLQAEVALCWSVRHIRTATVCSLALWYSRVSKLSRKEGYAVCLANFANMIALSL